MWVHVIVSVGIYVEVQNVQLSFYFRVAILSPLPQRSPSSSLRSLSLRKGAEGGKGLDAYSPLPPSVP
jgi:hypothetical protein